MQHPASILTIGDELLLGQKLDTNAHWLSDQLTQGGFLVVQKKNINDTFSGITRAIATAFSVADVVVMTGGLGPTKDDVTKKAIARFFQDNLQENPEVTRHLEQLFLAKGREMTDGNRQQAWVPSRCAVLHNAVGTAPGMWMSHKGKVLISMPGVPYEMKQIFSEIALPRLQKHFRTAKTVMHKVQTVGMPESILAKKIEDWENQLPKNVQLAYLPHFSQVTLRLTARGTAPEALRAMLEAEAKKLDHYIGKYIYGTGDAQLEAVLGELLLEKGATVATAESCTGGQVAHKISSIAGASCYFLGGIVAYSNEIKHKLLGVPEGVLQQYGAVSEETARAMAEGTRRATGADYGIATTGVAGPGGGSPEKPVGTVWLGLATPEGTKARKLQLTQKRDLNVNISTVQALEFLRRELRYAEKGE